MTYDTIVFFGRIEPLHNGHLNILRRLLGMAGRVVVLIGSAGLPRSPQHPWTFDERRDMIHVSLGDHAARITCQQVADHLYVPEAWRAEIARAVADVDGSVAVVGDLPLPWPRIEVDETISDQELRDDYFDGNMRSVEDKVPPEVAAFLETFRHGDAFPELFLEHETIQKYKRSWASAPYAPVFVTVDTVAVCRGHTLLIQRKGFPGKGLWAFPGGFIEPGELLVDSARRELREETGLDLPSNDFVGKITATHVFDYPQRSQRGRTISHGFHIDLGDAELPQVTGADDAMQAKWVPIIEARTMRDRMFEDHFSILEYFLGL